MHEFLENEDGSFRLTNYHLRQEDIEYVYGPYGKHYMEARKMINRERTKR